MSDTPDRRDAGRELLRVATQKIQEDIRARAHVIYVVREWGLSWEDVAHETGLSIPTCRKLRDQYLEERQAVTA